jgi:hypothetical protein
MRAANVFVDLIPRDGCGDAGAGPPARGERGDGGGAKSVAQVVDEYLVLAVALACLGRELRGREPLHE